MKSHWITYQDKSILYCDYSNYGQPDFDQLKAELDEVVALLVQQPKDSVLAITDIRGSTASREAVALFKEAGIETVDHIHKQAVVGVTGLKKILYDAVIRISRQPAKPFGDLELEEAKQWLVADE